jgi:hypothetical protein
MVAAAGAESAFETPLENPNSRIVVVGQILCVLIPLAVWFAPLPLFLLVAELLLVLAFIEYARLAAASGLPIPSVPAGAATIIASLGMASFRPT